VALIVDTGPLVALLDASDPDHLRCDALLQQAAEPRMVPVCVLVEVEYMLRPWADAFPALLAEFEGGGFEMLGEQKVATLDHRHFSVVRPAHVEALAILP
jgi:uncharacterized protein